MPPDVTRDDIQRLFRTLPGLFLVLEPGPDFIIVAASQEYLHATHSDTSIFGQPAFEVFPESIQTSGSAGASRVEQSFQRVIDTGLPDEMPLQRYDVRAPDSNAFEEKWWAAVNAPVLDAQGKVQYVVHRVVDASAHANSESVEVLVERARLVAESEKQRRIYETVLNSTPDLVYVFDLDHHFIYANEALLKMWGTNDFYGKKLRELGYEEWHAAMHDREIEQVKATRMPIRGEVPFNGTDGRRIYDYIFAPVIGPDGRVVAIAGTTRDVTDRQAAEQAMREQAQKLAESDRAKDDFLATLSHELRNPLAPLRNSIALLRMGAGDPKSAPIHSMMERQINHVVRLVDDLLEVSRINRGLLSLRKDRVCVADVVRNALEASEGLIQAAGHTLSVDLPTQAMWLDGDAVRLSQILDNLLNNAAKYTPGGGQIAVTVRSEAGHAVISVRDNGPGISAGAQARLFEMFNRGDQNVAGVTGGHGGLGIGLALSRRLAAMHDGTLDARSDGAGKGSEFVLRVPLAGPFDTAPAVPPQSTTQSSPIHMPLDKTRVLVVDDNHDAGDTMGQILELLGADVRTARDGLEALATFQDYRPSVVLLDIGMPGMSGYEVAQAIRTRYPGDTTKLVALTGWGQDDDRRRARDAGFDHHMVKPADIAALEALLASMQA
ncbi:ATP-binding protein [Caenimonas sp. SL110]|uniref:PAS domain-containing hybrid sensor histidine kinase/response regulator n=1 Tax=Caenimonas sp. SL110 TaxID=1450524 RepID=UPI00069FD801|nr:ATP-binding protein [Caenimonas sp. SL110]